MMTNPLIKVSEAQRLLGVSKKKMASLIAEGTISYESDPLDKRVKLVKTADVERLMEPRLRKVA